MKSLRSLSSASRPDSPTSKSRRSSSRTTPDPTPPPKQKPTSVFAFTQINVANFDRAEAFFEKVFNWRFIGEPTTPAFASPPVPVREGEPLVRMAPPIAPPPDHRVNYFTPSREVGQGRIAGALFKFRPDSRAGHFGGRKDAGTGGEKAGEETRIPNVINYVAVEDLTIALNAVRLAGGKTVVQPWMERDEMARFALFEDTEGNVFGLVQYLM
ncbi:hypothetical protein BR93DRAFT_981203 [Coniochaeta sp. PMI_546]|nr:hypothetical protein BR93DRAFT_981203 [Coniochaeta sp. PMI_546]